MEGWTTQALCWPAHLHKVVGALHRDARVRLSAPTCAQKWGCVRASGLQTHMRSPSYRFFSSHRLRHLAKSQSREPSRRQWPPTGDAILVLIDEQTYSSSGCTANLGVTVAALCAEALDYTSGRGVLDGPCFLIGYRHGTVAFVLFVGEHALQSHRTCACVACRARALRATVRSGHRSTRLAENSRIAHLEFFPASTPGLEVSHPVGLQGRALRTARNRS